MFRRFPVDIHGGLPDLRPDLSWAVGVPFHILGAYAALQLGPGALNLVGSRAGSLFFFRG